MPHLPHLGVPVPMFLAIFAGLGLLFLLTRVRVIGRIVSVLMTVGLLGLAAFLLADRAQYDPALGDIVRALHLDGEQKVVGGETRVPMARDGHFWVTVSINGVKQRMLVDSGATVTALSAQTAAAAGLRVEQPIMPMQVQTANGAVNAKTATVPELRLGNIVARDLPVIVSPSFGDMNVIGMNFLSRLQSWSVEGRTLVLQPHHPQAVK